MGMEQGRTEVRGCRMHGKQWEGRREYLVRPREIQLKPTLSLLHHRQPLLFPLSQLPQGPVFLLMRAHTNKNT